MEITIMRHNMKMALQKVKRNKGAAGIDGMTVNSLRPYLKEHWPSSKEQLLQGSTIPNLSAGSKSRNRTEGKGFW